MIVVKSDESFLEFDNGLVIEGDGEEDCCAYNYLDFEQLPVGTKLPTMTASEFVESIVMKHDGFIVKDFDNTPKWVQARSHQNGYYSNITTLIVKDKNTVITVGDFGGEVDEGY